MNLQRKNDVRPNKKTNSWGSGHAIRLPYAHSTKDLPGNLSSKLNLVELTKRHRKTSKALTILNNNINHFSLKRKDLYLAYYVPHHLKTIRHLNELALFHCSNLANLRSNPFSLNLLNPSSFPSFGSSLEQEIFRPE